jgi:hypothetical protein
LLKQLERQHSFQNDDRQQIDKARNEAEALFRPKRQSIEPSTSADPSQVDSSARKPRILSASASPASHVTTKDPIVSEPQTEPAVAVSSSAYIQRERLNSARAAIFEQQRELQAKLDTIDTEMRAIDAYEAAQAGKSPLGPRRSSVQRGRASSRS